MPGKALKLDDAQKKVSSHSGTKMQLGSGWKPGNMGLLMVLLRPCLEAAEIQLAKDDRRVIRVRRIAAILERGQLGHRIVSQEAGRSLVTYIRRRGSHYIYGHQNNIMGICRSPRKLEEVTLTASRIKEEVKENPGSWSRSGVAIAPT